MNLQPALAIVKIGIDDNEAECIAKVLDCRILDRQIMIANPWPKTTTLVEPGHRSPESPLV